MDTLEHLRTNKEETLTRAEGVLQHMANALMLMRNINPDMAEEAMKRSQDVNFLRDVVHDWYERA